MGKALYESGSPAAQAWYLTGNDWSQATEFTVSIEFIQEDFDPWPSADLSIFRIYCGIGMLDIRIRESGALVVEVNTDDGGQTSESAAGVIVFGVAHELMVTVNFADTPKILAWVDQVDAAMPDFEGSPTETEFWDSLGQEVEILDRIGGGAGGGGAEVKGLTTRRRAIWLGQTAVLADAIAARIDPLDTNLGTPTHYYSLDETLTDTGSNPYTVLYNGSAQNIVYVDWIAPAMATWDTWPSAESGVVNSDGGEILALTLDLDDGDWYVDVTLDPEDEDTERFRAYSAIPGQGTLCKSLGGVLEFAVPQLPPDEDYALLITSADDPENVVEVLPFLASWRRPLFSSTFAFRRSLPDHWPTGPNEPGPEEVS